MSRTEALAAIVGKLRQLGRITSRRPSGAVLFAVVVQGALAAGCGDDARVDRTSKAPEVAQVAPQGAPVAALAGVSDGDAEPVGQLPVCGQARPRRNGSSLKVV